MNDNGKTLDDYNVEDLIIDDKAYERRLEEKEHALTLENQQLKEAIRNIRNILDSIKITW